MTKFIEKPTAITPNRELQSDEYFNETDHLIYCSKCNTPRQCRHELQGKVLIPSIRCKCQQEIFEQEEAQRKLHEKQMEIEHLKTSGLQDKALYDYSMRKILMFSLIVHGNLNIRENKKCGEISLLELRKSHMIWNCNRL